MAWQNTDTKIDDAIALMETVADVASTLSGSLVALSGVAIPIIAMFAPLSLEERLGAFGSGGLIGGAGAAIARQKPTLQKKSLPVETETDAMVLDEY